MRSLRLGKVIKSIEELKTLVENLKDEGKTIVFTNGCFDILHAGHVDYLEKAKSFGDVLIVGVNSDSSIKRIKGEKRPINKQEHRVKVLSALNCVDYVIVFDEDTPIEVIKAVKPDVLVKGADWKLEDIVGREYAKRVERIEFSYDVSTTKIIEKILRVYG